jgi:hypothetical protein
MPDFELNDDAKNFARDFAFKFAKSAGKQCGTVIALGVLTVLFPGAAPAGAVAIPIITTIKYMIDDFNT